jgi:hypothetical protein
VSETGLAGLRPPPGSPRKPSWVPGARMGYMGQIIFPKDSLPIECTLDILPMQIEQSKTAKGAKFLPICIKYYSELTGMVHETSSVFIFGITDPILALDPDTQRFLSKKVCFERMAGFDRIT